MPHLLTDLKNRLNGLLRYTMVYGLTEALSLYVVNEYPRSGGTWIGQMLASALDIPFPRKRFPVWRSSIMHGHYLRPGRIRKPIIVWRDGRDVMVSWYYYCLFIHDASFNEQKVRQSRQALAFHDYEDIHANLPLFLEYVFTRQPHPRFSWTDFVNRWHGRQGVIHTRYEDCRHDPAGELTRIVRELTGKHLDHERAHAITDHFSFARQSGRQPGQEDIHCFLRKGLVGDWVTQFSPAACQVFDHYAGEALIRLGYERDCAWAQHDAVSPAVDRHLEFLPDPLYKSVTPLPKKGAAGGGGGGSHSHIE